MIDKEVEKRSHQFSRSRKGSIFEQTVSGSQKGWESKTCDKFETVERVHNLLTFQDGRFVLSKKKLLRKGGYINKLDLKDAYF